MASLTLQPWLFEQGWRVLATAAAVSGLTAPHEATSHQQRCTVALADDTPKDTAFMETEAWQIDPPGSGAGFHIHCCVERIICGRQQ
ncbi:hypothetical protein WJX77_010432 [Trebouxia sp. C0004]